MKIGTEIYPYFGQFFIKHRKEEFWQKMGDNPVIRTIAGHPPSLARVHSERKMLMAGVLGIE